MITVIVRIIIITVIIMITKGILIIMRLYIYIIQNEKYI